MSDHGHHAPKASPKSSSGSSNGIGPEFAFHATATVAMGFAGLVASLLFRR